MDWARWKMGVRGRRLAVFRFAMRDIAADLEVGFCCLAESDAPFLTKERPRTTVKWRLIR